MPQNIVKFKINFRKPGSTGRFFGLFLLYLFRNCVFVFFQDCYISKGFLDMQAGAYTGSALCWIRHRLMLMGEGGGVVALTF